MSRNFQALRILNLFFLLCKHRRTGLTIGFICETLTVNKRTLYRDLAALKEVGVNIVHQRDEDASIRVYLKSIPVVFE